MFLFHFPLRAIDTFKQGSFPKVAHISHTFDNPNWHFALHGHPDCIELIYVAGGMVTIVVGREVFEAKAGDILLVDKGIAHSITSNPACPSDLWSLSASNVEFCEPYVGKMIPALTQAAENKAFVENTMLQIQEFSGRLDIPVQAVCNHLCAALIVLFRQMLLQSSAGYAERAHTLAEQVLSYIDQNYTQRIDLENLAKVFFVSPSHISREFKNEFRISPINYLIDKRLSEAKWLLINTTEPIGSLAMKIGYDNVYYFTKLFTERIGMSPSEYRKQYAAFG